MTASFFRIQDVADILIMTFLVYQLYSWFRKTRAMQVLLGLGVVTMIYFSTRFLGLYMTSWILQELGTVLIVLVIVVFQAEIRQTLYRFSLMRYFFDSQRIATHSRYKELAETLFNLAEKRVGAIVVMQREELLTDYMLNGIRLDCEVSSQIIETIFHDGTPLHDGAMLVKNGRIEMAACHLPLSISSDLPQHLGTRHRAALGLSERSDGLVLVVSEERGEVSCVVHGELSVMGTVDDLTEKLEELLCPEPEKPIMTIWQRLFSNMLPKIAIFLLVTAFWVLITSRQGQITTVAVPLRFHGLSDSLVVLHTAPEELEVQLKSFSSLAPQPAKIDMIADVDLSMVRDGNSVVRVKAADVTLPPGVTISSINPSVIKVQAEKKVRKKVPVKVVVRGNPPKGYRIVSEPGLVELEGAASRVAKIEQVATGEIDAGKMIKGKVYQTNLQLNSGNVMIIGEEYIMLKLQKNRSNQK